MGKENIHQALEVYYEQVTACPLRDRQFNFFEFVYVLSGTGTHVVNDNAVEFKCGDFFLITPHDYHSFDLATVSEFLVIRFDKTYIWEYQWKSIDHIEYLLFYASHLSGPLLQNEADKQLTHSLILSLLQTIRDQEAYQEDLKRHLVNALIVIAARTLSRIKPVGLAMDSDTKILDIIDYVQQNIQYPKNLKVAVIAEKVGFSVTYLGTFFRNQCGETLQHYISNYRIRLMEHRLKFSNKRVNEIVEEFGFTDESHINKFFKKHKGMTISAYKTHLNSQKPENVEVA